MKLEKLYKGRQGRPEKGGKNFHLFEGKGEIEVRGFSRGTKCPP
jgi:hypothetical protein